MVSRNTTGVVAVMTFFQMRKTPPMTRATMQVSPTLPPRIPRSMFSISGRGFRPSSGFLRIARGVAPETASTPK